MPYPVAYESPIASMCRVFRAGGAKLPAFIGLPATITPDFTLTRESDQSTTDIAAGAVKQGLSPGSYMLTAKSYPSGAVTYDPQPASQTVTIAAGGTLKSLIPPSMRSAAPSK